MPFANYPAPLRLRWRSPPRHTSQGRPWLDQGMKQKSPDCVSNRGLNGWRPRNGLAPKPWRAG